MKVAVMQPYFLPYIGYFQLMATADVFVLLDDVSFINRGWVNRNRLLLNGQPWLFTLPLAGASQNRRICDLALAEPPRWRERLLATVDQAYRRAPQHAPVRALLERVLHAARPDLAGLLLESLREVATLLSIDTLIRPSSRAYGNDSLKGQERILDICRREGATTYLNAPGGSALYDPAAFEASGIALRFVQPLPTSYSQHGDAPHVPWLSILDVLMFNEPATVRRMLGQVTLQAGPREASPSP